MKILMVVDKAVLTALVKDRLVDWQRGVSFNCVYRNIKILMLVDKVVLIALVKDRWVDWQRGVYIITASNHFNLVGVCILNLYTSGWLSVDWQTGVYLICILHSGRWSIGRRLYT